MKSFRITNTASGADLGVYQGADAEGAIRAMLADAGAADQESDPDLRAVEVEGHGASARVHVAVGAITASDCAARGWDAPVTVTLPTGEAIDGEVTLVVSDYDDRPSSWGQPDHWLSSSLRHLDRDVLRAIEAAVAAEIESSDVEPSAAETHD